VKTRKDLFNSKLIPDYNHDDFFSDQADEIKLLATVTNQFSGINSTCPDDLWYPISRMVLSTRDYRSFLMKTRFLDEDKYMRNFPLIFEKRGETIKKILKRWFVEQNDKLKRGEDGEIAGELRESVEQYR
jgi:hypothetical protein